MEKNWYASKTIWGFGIAGLILLFQTLGYLDITTLTESLKILSGFLGTYGLRSALN